MRVDVFLTKPTFIRVSTSAALLLNPDAKRAHTLDVFWSIHQENVEQRIQENRAAYENDHFNGGLFSTDIMSQVVVVDRAFGPKFNRITEIMTPEEFKALIARIEGGVDSMTFIDEKP